MNLPFASERDILAALYADDPLLVNAGLKHLYLDKKLRMAVKKQVISLGGSEDEVQEIFQQSLIIFFNAVTDGRYEAARSSIATFIVGIARKCYQGMRRSGQQRDLGAGDYPMQPMAADEELVFESRQELLDRILSVLGERCKQLLKLRSFGYSMEKVAGMVGYKNANAAKVAVHSCRKKLLAFLATRPDLLDELNDI